MTNLISHSIRVRLPHARQVALIGDFNDWDSRAHPLVQVAPGLWERAVSLPAGKHRYAFLVVEDAPHSGGTVRTRVEGDGAVLWVPENPEQALSVTSYPARVASRQERQDAVLQAA